MKITNQILNHSSTKRISKRGGIFTKLGAILLALLFLVLIFVLFLGNSGKLNIAKEKLIEVIRGVPEVDQTQKQMTFFQTNDAQLKFVSGWNNEIKNALAGTDKYGGCIMTLDSLETDGFYQSGANYNLHIDQTGTDITMSLTRYTKQDYDKNAVKTEVPVTTTKINNVQLCIIQGQSALDFYNEFNDINTGETPDITKIKPVPVNSILISSGKSEDTQREIGYSTAVTKPASDADYTWATFFKSSTKTTIYAVRLVNNGVNYVCLIPTYNDKIDIFSSCGGPKSGLIQTDCLDTNGGKDSLKYNFGQTPPLIPPYYICGNTALAQSVAGTSP